ncbi:MAG: HlyD family efflux transporter periplasmic adaptor subunit [Bacteroidales bacterium]|jgi:HlyD family secretion protein|nr:HlyD family efflux transporter periplasmic adaptor subunit [Bacteroidales bacterium]
MTRNPFVPILLGCLVLLSACGRSGKPDAYGIIDAHSWMIAASEAGQIMALPVEEGQRVERGAVAVQLDTAALSLQLRAFEAQIRALQPTVPDVGRQLDVLHRQRESLQNERERIAPLVSSGAASRRQLDNLDDQLRVLDSQISAARSSLSRETAAVLVNIESLKSQADIVRDRIARCTVTCPETGTVTALYAHLHEFVDAGHPIFKLADLQHMYVDAWLEGGDLTRIALGDAVDVKVDAEGGTLRTLPGRISYISDEAEFTPNKVLTRDTRASLVYHVRIDLAEDARLRSGMPAEIYLPSQK